MRRKPHLFRLTATVALTALLWDEILPVAAVAQPAPPPLPQPYQTQPTQLQGDPPSRVGRVAGLTGTVSFHNLGDTQWSRASVNYPVSSGNAFWTEPAAEAQLEIAGSRIAMAGTTELDIATLDSSGLQAVAAQGETYFHLRGLTANEAWSVQTPRGLVRLNGEGRYDIVVGTTEQPTLVTVIDGSAQVDGPGVSLRVGSNETATINGIDSFEGSVGPGRSDAFLTARLDAERPRPRPSAQVRPAQVPAQVAAMPGGSDLNQYGDWSEAPQYGQVWYPPVSQGWVPYRHGHWAYVAPWGWTWIDDAPWGFAPFHYGRWIEIGDRWAWTPGGYAVAEPPVYAPALVAFVGIGAGIAVGAVLASGSIGWVPLGPREPFRPWYQASDGYRQQINSQHVTNITNTNVTTTNNNNTIINNFVNRGAATAVPSAAMAASRPVQSVAQPVSAQQFAAARPIVGQQPVRPNIATAGVTPAVARQLNLGPAAALPASPGPAVRIQAPGTPVRAAAIPGSAVSGATAARPAVPVPTLPGAATPGPAVHGPAIHGPATPGAAVTGPAVSGAALQGTARPPLVPPGRAEPGGTVGVAGIPAVQPGHPGSSSQGPASGPAAANLAASPASQNARAPQVPPAVVRPAEPGFTRSADHAAASALPSAAVRPVQPTVVRPAESGIVGPGSKVPAPAPQPAAVRPAPSAAPPPSGSRALPQAVAPSRPEAAQFAMPAAPHLAPAAPPPHVVAPNVMPRVEPPHAAPPAPMPRAEPPHFSAPAPRPAQPPPAIQARAAPMPAAPAPAAREKRPGER